MAHRIHTVTRVPGRPGSSRGPIKIGADDKLPEQVGFVYEELMDHVNQFREEIAALQERVRELERRGGTGALDGGLLGRLLRVGPERRHVVLGVAVQSGSPSRLM